MGGAQKEEAKSAIFFFGREPEIKNWALFPRRGVTKDESRDLSMFINEIMNRFHLEGHGVAPHLPLTATETQANTQDPGALRLPRLPFHPIALRLTRATNAYPLHPAALAFVSYGIVLVQVQVHERKRRRKNKKVKKKAI